MFAQTVAFVSICCATRRRAAAVVGVPDERLGEEVAAFVAVKPGASLTEAELIGYCKQRVAACKYPRRVEFRGELPKNASGKIVKSMLR